MGICEQRRVVSVDIDGRFLKNAFFFFTISKMRRQYFFGECARNEKHILNDRGAVKKSDAKIQRDQRNKTAFFKNSPSIYILFLGLLVARV